MQHRIVPAVLLLTAVPLQAIAQQSSTSNMTVRGSVGAAALLAPPESNPLSIQGDVAAQAIVVDKSNIIVRLAGSSASRNARVRVRMLMRTNTAYELRATASNATPAPAITVNVRSIHSTGPGVIPAAVSGARSISSAVELSAEAAVLVSGPRISRGSASSPRNAIEIELLMEVGAPASDGWSKDIRVAIAPGAAF